MSYRQTQEKCTFHLTHYAQNIKQKQRRSPSPKSQSEKYCLRKGRLDGPLSVSKPKPAEYVTKQGSGTTWKGHLTTKKLSFNSTANEDWGPQLQKKGGGGRGFYKSHHPLRFYHPLKTSEERVSPYRLSSKNIGTTLVKIRNETKRPTTNVSFNTAEIPDS